MNNSLSWSVHFLLKPEEELRLTCQMNYSISTSYHLIIYLFRQRTALTQHFTLSALPSSRHRLAAITGWFISMYTCNPFVRQHHLTVSTEMWRQYRNVLHNTFCTPLTCSYVPQEVPTGYKYYRIQSKFTTTFIS